MLPNLSSRWGLSDHAMHGRWVFFVFQREKQKPLLLTCMAHRPRKGRFYSLSQAYGLSRSSSAAAAASCFFLPFLSLRPYRTNILISLPFITLFSTKQEANQEQKGALLKWIKGQKIRWNPTTPSDIILATHLQRKNWTIFLE